MPVIIHGDNKGIAVDGDLSIEKLDFQFGRGVVAVEGVKKPEMEDAVIVEVEKSDADKKKAYPAVTDMQRNFFESAFTINGKLTGQAPKVIEMPVDMLMYRIHDLSVDWNPVEKTSVHKWKLLYRVICRLKYVHIEEKERYKEFVAAVVRYCFPDVKDTYSNNISKSPLNKEFEMWEYDDRQLFLKLKEALTFE